MDDLIYAGAESSRRFLFHTRGSRYVRFGCKPFVRIRFIQNRLKQFNLEVLSGLVKDFAVVVRKKCDGDESRSIVLAELCAKYDIGTMFMSNRTSELNRLADDIVTVLEPFKVRVEVEEKPKQAASAEKKSRAPRKKVTNEQVTQDTVVAVTELDLDESIVSDLMNNGWRRISMY